MAITAGEDAPNQHDQVFTVVAHPSLRRVVSHRALSHYSLSRAYSQMAGGTPLGRARNAASLLEAFGLRAPPPTSRLHRAPPPRTR